MAQRYKQAKKGMREAKSYSGMGYYQGPQERVEQELRDASMIQEDHAAVANLPQQVVMRSWPKGGRYSAEHLDDTIRGIDRQLDADGDQMYRHGHMGYDPEKY